MKAPIAAMLLGCLHGTAFAELLAPTAAAPLAPAGKWQIDYGANECRLIRAFGGPANSTTFQITKIDPGLDLAPAFALASYSFRTSRAERTIEIRTTNHAEVQSLSGSVLNVEVGAPPILFIPRAGVINDIIQEDITAARPTVITVVVEKVEVSLALGKMAQPIAALNGCMDDLMRSWGYNPTEQHQLKSHPIPITPPSTWVNSTDYPAAMIREKKSGGVTARLDIGLAGEIIGCHVMEAGGDPAFQQATCAVLRKAGRFRPAINKDGKPVASYFPLKLVWAM